jgi:oligopeptide transport system ATP-binding protein
MNAAARSPQDGAEILLEVENLTMHFPVTRGVFFQRRVGTVHAVDGISFGIRRGETLGLVGESGCGKSTTGRAVLQLHRPSSGSVRYAGLELTTLSSRQLRSVRRRMQMIFQDPYASLNPRMTVSSIISEPIRTYGLLPRRQIDQRVAELMEVVGLNPRYIRRYPHEFSGGQRQRIGIARALAAEPDFLVCDEPISALDVSIQAQILNLLADLQKRFALTYLFIAHDLAAVRHVSDRIAVMYLGKIVELAPYEKIYRSPRHPYTQALISAVPIPDPEIEAQRQRIVLQGDVPSPRNPPSGCRFKTRCPYRFERCEDEPPLQDYSGSGHFAACWLNEVADPPEGWRSSAGLLQIQS